MSWQVFPKEVFVNAWLVAAALVLNALPFPPPKVITVTDKTKCDWGPIASVSAAGTEVVVTTPAGLVTYKVSPETQIIGPDGKPMGGVSVLRAGQTIRVYYLVDNGAKAQEIDVQ